MPIDKEKISNQAQKYFQKGQYDKAIKEYQKIIEADPSDMRIWKKIGDIQVKAGKTREAIATYLKLADNFFAQGFYTKALALLRQIQTMDASIEEVYLKLADVYVASNFLPDAIHQLDRLSKLQEAAGNIEAMIATLHKMADLDPQTWTYRAHLAETLSRLGRKAEASAELRKVTAQLERENNLADFIRVAERLMFHDPDDMENVKKLANAYLQTRAGEEKLKQVLKVLLKFLQNNPSDENLLQLLARMFLAISKQESAVNVYRELARIYREQGRIAESEAVLEKILEIVPQDEETLIALGRKKAPPLPEKKVTSARRGGRDYSEPVEELSLEELEVIEEEEAPDAFRDELVGEDLKNFEEAKVFFQFSLFDQVLEILGKIRAREALPVLELEKNVYMRMGNKEKAVPIMERLAAAWENSDPEKAAEVAREMLIVDPASSLAARILEKRPGAEPEREDDLFKILQEIQDIETELPPQDVGLDDLLVSVQTGLHSEEEVQRELRQLEISRGTGVYEIPDEEIDFSVLESFGSMASASEPVLEGDDYDSMPSQVSDLPFGDLVMQGKLDELDELEAFKEASQSFIRIQELSHENIRLSELESLPVPELPAAEPVLSPEKEELLNGAPPSAGGDFFQLGADEPTPVRPEPVFPRDTYLESGSGFEPTLDHVRELLTLDDQFTSEFSGEAEREKEPEPVQPPELPAELEEAFAEVDFFLDQELFDEAIDMLGELQSRYPIEFLRDKMTAVYRAAGREDELAQFFPEPAGTKMPAKADPFELPFGEEPPKEPAGGAVLPSSAGDENFSLDFDEEVVTNLSGLALESLGQLPDAAPSKSVEPAHGVRVESDIPEGDATFFDLGVAYKEMGLYDQAIAQFQLAMQEPRLAIKSHMMVAQCLMEMGKFSEAASEYKKTLHVENITKDEEMDLYFELGQLYERLEDTPEALYFYRKVMAWNPRYRNVSQIVGRLQ